MQQPQPTPLYDNETIEIEDGRGIYQWTASLWQETLVI
jgi:hypothetical protein